MTCEWCRECGSCDYGLMMSCTCGDCTCESDCGFPRCGAVRIRWESREPDGIIALPASTPPLVAPDYAAEFGHDGG
jgi:hypothetical protein